MAFNGTGVFVRLYNWVNDRNNNINIRADRMDNEMNGFATGLTDCVTRDGQSPALANLPMGGFRHINVQNGALRNDYSALGQLQDGTVNWIVAAGTSDAITAAYNPAVTALIDGQLCFFRASAANTTTSPTFSPNGLTASVITKNGGSALAAGDIAGNLAEIVLRYNLANTRWEIINPKPPVVSPVFSDATFRIQDNADATKQIAFEASGITTGTTRTLTIPDADITVVGIATTQTLTNKSMSGGANTFTNIPLTTAVTGVLPTANGGSRIAQVANTETGVYATGGTTQIPFDNTVPQQTEGDQYMTLSITPTNASSTLYVDVNFIGSLSTADNLVVALFRDAAAGAIAAAAEANIVNGLQVITIKHKISAASTSASTFKVRAGPGTSGTISFNGVSGGGLFGGVVPSNITITEVLP